MYSGWLSSWEIIIYKTITKNDSIPRKSSSQWGERLSKSEEKCYRMNAQHVITLLSHLCILDSSRFRRMSLNDWWGSTRKLMRCSFLLATAEVRRNCRRNNVFHIIIIISRTHLTFKYFWWKNKLGKMTNNLFRVSTLSKQQDRVIQIKRKYHP